MAEEKAEAAPKSNKKMIIIIAAVVLLAGGGAGGYLMMKPKADHGKEEKKEEVHEEAAKPVFMTLETFTVNLVPEGEEQYLQTDISLQISDPHADQAIKDQMPLVKSTVLMLLSSKKASEINTSEGKTQLTKELISALNSLLGGGHGDHEEKHGDKEKEHADKEHADKEHGDKKEEVSGPVKGVFFTSFIIQ